MRRRNFLGVAAASGLAAKTKADIAAVTDIDKLNAFASEYNDYIKNLQAGLVRVERWKKVVERWRRMTEK